MLSLLIDPNPILATDTYKYGHWQEIPPNAKRLVSAVVPRKMAYYADEIVAMGQTLVASIFEAITITQDHIEEAAIEIAEQGYEFNRAGWQLIVDEYGGKLPVTLYGVEEGSIIQPQTPILTVVANDDRLAWLSPYYEPWVQGIVWKMTTVASICRKVRVTFRQYMEATGSNMAELDYKLHNFGDRGAHSPDEAPIVADIAHNALFNGSDCGRSNRVIKRLYGLKGPASTSVEATEHTVMCLHSDAPARDDFGAAVLAVERLEAAVERSKRGIGIPLVSAVIDTYDSKRFVREYIGVRLKERILASGGRLVARPDSGDPTVEPGERGNDLAQAFGVTYTDKGYKRLHPAVGIIQGDGIRVTTFEGVLKGWMDAGFCFDNFCLGMGGGVTGDGMRDDFSFSQKSIAVVEGDDNAIRRLLKEPITDRTKKSLTGLIATRRVDDKIVVVDLTDTPSEFFDYDGPGWRQWYSAKRTADGVVQTNRFKQSFESVRELARSGT